MRLHEDSKLFKQAVRATAQQMGLLDIYVEKDYWVTFALYTIFNHEIGKQTVFKGGTALSKCYGLIERFSEDIDLVVLRNEGEPDYQLTKKIKKISKVVAAVIPEVNITEVTKKMGMNRKTAHEYAKAFKGNYGQVRDVIIVEATWLGHYEPYTSATVSSYIYQMMQKNAQQKIAVDYGLLPFDVLVLDVKRTLCEKIMSLVRFSHTNQAIEDLNKKIRHTYDIHRLLQDKNINNFFNSSAFNEMLLKVAQDDVASYKNDNSWLQHHPRKALLFADTQNTWGKMKDTYQDQFKNLVFGVLPDESEILASIEVITNRLEGVEWTIDLNT